MKLHKEMNSYTTHNVLLESLVLNHPTQHWNQKHQLCCTAGGQKFYRYKTHYRVDKQYLHKCFSTAVHIPEFIAATITYSVDGCKIPQKNRNTDLRAVGRWLRVVFGFCVTGVLLNGLHKHAVYDTNTETSCFDVGKIFRYSTVSLTSYPYVNNDAYSCTKSQNYPNSAEQSQK